MSCRKCNVERPKQEISAEYTEQLWKSPRERWRPRPAAWLNFGMFCDWVIFPLILLFYGDIYFGYYYFNCLYPIPRDFYLEYVSWHTNLSINVIGRGGIWFWAYLRDKKWLKSIFMMFKFHRPLFENQAYFPPNFFPMFYIFLSNGKNNYSRVKNGAYELILILF